MEPQTAVQLSANEQVLVEIVRHLPRERVEQVIDFAKFIEWQISQAEIEKLPSEDESDDDCLYFAKEMNYEIHFT